MPEMYSERHQVDRNSSHRKSPAQGREADESSSERCWEGSGERRPPAKPGPSTGGGEGRRGPLVESRRCSPLLLELRQGQTLAGVQEPNLRPAGAHLLGAHLLSFSDPLQGLRSVVKKEGCCPLQLPPLGFSLPDDFFTQIPEGLPNHRLRVSSHTQGTRFSPLVTEGDPTYPC